MNQLYDRRASFIGYLRTRFAGGQPELVEHISEIPDEEILDVYMKGHMSEAVALDDSQINHILLENSNNEEAYKALSEARHQKHIDDVRASVAVRYANKASNISYTDIIEYQDLNSRLLSLGISIVGEDIDNLLKSALSFYSDWVCNERSWSIETHRTFPRMSYQDVCEACLLAQSLDKYPTFNMWMTGEFTGEMDNESITDIKCELYTSQIVSFIAEEVLELINEGVPSGLENVSKVFQSKLVKIHEELTAALFLYLSQQSLYTAWLFGLPVTQRDEQTQAEMVEFMGEVGKHFRALYPQGCSSSQHKKFLCDVKNLAATLDTDKLWMLSNEGIPIDIPQSLIRKAQSIIERELEKKSSAPDSKEVF